MMCERAVLLSSEEGSTDIRSSRKKPRTRWVASSASTDRAPFIRRSRGPQIAEQFGDRWTLERWKITYRPVGSVLHEAA